VMKKHSHIGSITNTSRVGMPHDCVRTHCFPSLLKPRDFAISVTWLRLVAISVQRTLFVVVMLIIMGDTQSYVKHFVEISFTA
jgi:hypothetical protein